MATIIDLTSTTSFYTGSMYFVATSTGAAVEAIGGPSQLTGSWDGLANTWGAFELLTVASASLQASGSWKGVAYSQSTTTLATSSFDRFTLTVNGSPNVNQSMAQTSWNPFPIPEVPAEERQAQRDMTRFRKSYSSQRMQPRPVRLRRG